MSDSTPGRFCAWLWRRPQRWYLLGVPIGAALALVAGIAVTGGAFAALQYASSEAFCTSCHEMSKPAAELDTRAHSSNALGIRTGCADCHIPPGFVAGTLRHVTSGMRDILGHLRSTLSTPTKYEAHRLEMAQMVWRDLREDDSAECTRCHTAAAMAAANRQARVAITPAVMHQSLSRSYTCIDCHKGIAHDLPASQ